jgi:hypothetical protein
MKTFQSIIARVRVQAAEWLAPSPTLTLRQSVTRYVAVRFNLPGQPPVIEVYDTQNAEDMKAWRLNNAQSPHWPSQVVATAAEPSLLTHSGMA